MSGVLHYTVLAELGEKYQQIFWMRYLEGYTESEIAEHLHLTLATVKTRAHRARVAVRDVYECRTLLALAERLRSLAAPAVHESVHSKGEGGVVSSPPADQPGRP